MPSKANKHWSPTKTPALDLSFTPNQLGVQEIKYKLIIQNNVLNNPNSYFHWNDFDLAL